MVRSRRSGRRSGYSHSFYHNSGSERARKHIEDAKRLTAELGGTDADVKKYFFSLSFQELDKIFDLYEKRYGASAREYASNTIPKWRSGAVTMSGTVASRLFDLLPPLMPIPEKYKLISNLWEHAGPKSKKAVRVGLDADINEVIEVIRGHIGKVVTEFRIPDNLERRFNWLAAGDSLIKQDFLNYLRNLEKELFINGAKTQLPVLMQHLLSDAGVNTHRAATILKLGKHEIEVIIDKEASGVILMNTIESTRRLKNNFRYRNVVFWSFIISAVVLVLMLKTMLKK